MIIKRDFFKIRISSSDHKNLIPYADEVIHNEDFYKCKYSVKAVLYA